jgi:hypothetical protein
MDGWMDGWMVYHFMESQEKERGEKMVGPKLRIYISTPIGQAECNFIFFA